MQASDHHNVSAVKKYVAGKITALRTERRWSQVAVASNCGMVPDQIGRMERGQVNVGVETLYRVVHSFDITMAEFFKDFEGGKSS